MNELPDLLKLESDRDHLDTDKNLITDTQPNIPEQNQIFLNLKENRENHPKGKELLEKKNSFINFMQNLDEYKDDRKMSVLKKAKINKARTLLFDELGDKKEDRDDNANRSKCPKSCSKGIRRLLMSPVFSFFATFAIVIILFIDDIRIIAIHKKYDTFIDVLMVIIISFIFFEISSFIIFIRGYRWSFFFWLDICSFCSLIPDLMILFVHDEYLDYYNLGNSSGIVSLFLGNTQLSKTSRASVSGTKAGRLVGFIKSFKLFSVINVGKAYKFAVDKMLKKSESLFFKDKLKEMIKLSRRKNINLVSTKDKMFFFKHIHNVLNNPDIFNTIRQSKINKDVIKNYYDYVMTNEREKKISEKKEKETQPINSNVTNININIQLVQQNIKNENTTNTIATNSTERIKIINKFKTIHHCQGGGNKYNENINRLLSFINGDSEHSNLIKSNETHSKESLLNPSQHKKRSKTLHLPHKEKAQDKMINFMKPIKENADAEDEESFSEGKIPKEKPEDLVEKLREPFMLLNENKPLNTGQRHFSALNNLPVLNAKERIRNQSKYSSGTNGSDLKMCLCRSSIHRPILSKLAKNESPVSEFRLESGSSDLSLRFSSLHKTKSSKVKCPTSKESGKLKTELKPFSSLNEIRERTISHHKPEAQITSEEEMIQTKQVQAFHPESPHILKKFEHKESEKSLSKLKIVTFSDNNVNSAVTPTGLVSKKSSKKIDLLKKDEFCKQCGGIVVNNFKRKYIAETKKTFMEHNPSASDSDSSSDEENVQRIIRNQNTDMTEMVSKRIESDESSESEGEDRVNFDNLPEVQIRYLFFDKIKTPKLALTVSKKTTIKVIFIILFLLFSEPFLNTSNYNNNFIDQYSHQIKMLDQYISGNRTDKFLSYFQENILNSTNRVEDNNDAFLLIGLRDNSSFNLLFPHLNLSQANLTDDGSVILYINNDQYPGSRRTQSVYVEYGFLFAIYDYSAFIKLGSILNICKIFYVAFILWIGSFLFLKDAYKIVVKPLEYISKKITIQQNNIEKLAMINNFNQIEEEEFKRMEEDGSRPIKIRKYNDNIETTRISEFVKNNGLLLLKLLGHNTFNYLNYKVLNQEMEILEKQKPLPYRHIRSIIMVIHVGGYYKFLNAFKENFTRLYSKIVDIIDLTLLENFGEIITVDQDHIVALFDEQKYISPQTVNLKSDIKPDSISMEDEESMSLQQRELHEEYHSFEGSKKSSPNESHIIEKTKDIKLENNQIKNMNIFALISCFKILFRIKQNPLLEFVLKSKGVSMKDLDLTISLESGYVFQHMLNTDYKIETIYSAKEIKRCMMINKFMRKYDLKICSSMKFTLGLESMKQFSREIDTFYDEDFGKSIKLFAYDIVLDPNPDASSYLEKMVLTKEKSLEVRNEHSKYINEKTFNVNLYFSLDPEIVFVRPKSLITFAKYYINGYKCYKNENYKQAFEAFKYAITICPWDKRTKQLYKELEQIMSGR